MRLIERCNLASLIRTERLDICRLNGHKLKPKTPKRLNYGDVLSFGGSERVTKHGRTLDNPFAFQVAAVPPRKHNSNSHSRCLSLSFDDSENHQCNGRQENETTSREVSHDDINECDELLCPICQDLLVMPVALVPCGKNPTSWRGSKQVLFICIHEPLLADWKLSRSSNVVNVGLNMIAAQIHK